MAITPVIHQFQIASFGWSVVFGNIWLGFVITFAVLMTRE